LAQELSLPAVAWVPDADHRYDIHDAVGCGSRIVPNRDDACWPQQYNKRLEEVLASTPFARVMLAIGKRIIRFVRVEWKHVPQEYSGINLIEHAPDDGSRPLGNRRTNRRSLGYKIPTPSMPIDMDIVSQRNASPASTAIPKISTNPDRVDRLSRRTFHHR
jgi:hypothetical protein